MSNLDPKETPMNAAALPKWYLAEILASVEVSVLIGQSDYHHWRRSFMRVRKADLLARLDRVIDSATGPEDRFAGHRDRVLEILGGAC